MDAPPHPLEPDEHRRARHFFALKNLTDRGYDLAMKAADCAEAQLAPPEPDADDPTSPPSAPNHHQTFERYVRAVRLLISLEHRIAHHPVGEPKRTYRPAGGAPNQRAGQADDPRRPILHQFLHQATRNSPDRAALRRETIAAIDEAIDSDPAFEVAAADLVSRICREYGLPFDIAKVPDNFLETATRGPPGPVRYDEAGRPIVVPRLADGFVAPARRMAPSG